MTLLDIFSKHYAQIVAIPMTAELLYGVETGDECAAALHHLPTADALDRIVQIIDNRIAGCEQCDRRYLDEIVQLRDFCRNPLAFIQTI